jgi:hypothetical protein
MEKEAQYLYDLVKPIVANPESVEVDQIIDERGTLLSLKLAKEDVGSIIGKGGEMARAIRKIVRLFGIINDKRISIKIIEPEHGDNKL